MASPTIPSSRFAIAFTPEHYRSNDLIGNLWGCFYKLKRSPRQSPPQRRSWVFGFGVVPRHLSLASAEAGVAKETRAAYRKPDVKVASRVLLYVVASGGKNAVRFHSDVLWNLTP